MLVNLVNIADDVSKDRLAKLRHVKKHDYSRYKAIIICQYLGFTADQILLVSVARPKWL